MAFALTEPGVASLERAVQSAYAVPPGAVGPGRDRVRRPLSPAVACPPGASHEVVELNPGQVKAAREAQGAAKIKTDLRDCAAIVDLVISGMGWSPQQRDAAMTSQLAWVTLRSRRVKARTALGNQLLGTLDLVFPGLDGCFDTLLATRIGAVLLHHLFDPDRMLDLGAPGLQAFVAEHGVRLPAERRRRSFGRPSRRCACPLPNVPAGQRFWLRMSRCCDALNADVARARRSWLRFCPRTPAGVLLSLPGGVDRPRLGLGAALGDPLRFASAEQPTAIAGMHPSPTTAPDADRGRPEARHAAAAPSCAPR